MTVDARLATRPITEHIGAEVEGVSVGDVLNSGALISAIRTALAEHLVLRFRGVAVSPAAMVEFMGLFGPVMDIRASTKDTLHVPGYDGIQVLSNAVDDSGKRFGDDNSSAQTWHTDAGQWEVPPGAVILYGRVIPDPAPRTYFKNMIKVYETLPASLKERIAPLRVIHHSYPRSVDVAVHRSGPSLPREAREQGQSQPLVRRHLPTGKPILYLPTRRDSVIPGLSDQESRDLLTALWHLTDEAPFWWGDAIQVDDLILWDNVATVHSRDGWPPEARRDVWHLLAEGEAPTPFHPRKTVNPNVVAQQSAY